MFTGLTFLFLKEFAFGLQLTFPLLASLAAVIVGLGQFVGRKEGWSRFDSFYWSFVTATTVGYGDFHPTRRVTRVLAIVVAFFGLLFTGILIAVAVSAGTAALKLEHGGSLP
jgi:voltage-gated potassium channel